VGLLLALLLLLAARPAAAHGYLLRAIPEDRATLDRAPTRLQYWFSEDLEPDFSSVNVRTQTGDIIATGGVDDDDRSLMAVRLPQNLSDGAYIVELRPAFASDGHVVAESRVFFVGEAVAGVDSAAASDAPLMLEVAWRSIVLTATIVLFGAFALYTLVLVPAWGSRNYRAGLLPPRVMTRLNRIVIFALVIAIAGNVLALLQQSMVFFSASASQVIEQELWQVVRIGSRFGDVWNARMLFLLLAAGLHGAGIYLRREQPDAVRAFWVANLWLVALIIGTFSAANHAAGSLLLPWVAMSVDWLHALAVGFWAGGFVALIIVLPTALRPYQGDARRRALLAVLRRFSRVATAAVVVVIATGIYSALNWVTRPEDITQTRYGNTLVLKAILVLTLLTVAAAHHIALRPARYRRWSRIIERVRSFNQTLRLEAVLIIAVLIAVGMLTASPIPVPAFAQRGVEAPSASATLDDLTVTLTISPGGPGVNTYDVVVTQDGEAVDDADVRLQFVNPRRDWRGNWQRVEAVESGLYVTAGDEIDETGHWWTLLDITQGDAAAQRLVVEWDIDDAAAIIQSRPPNALHIAAFAGVVASLTWAGLPLGRRYYHQLDLRPATLALVVAVTTITIVAIVISVRSITRVESRYDARINPPPTIVNTVLPDADSLMRGASLYVAHCLDWQAASGDFAALRNRLPRTRDDELFTITRDGWQDMPPCTGNLSDEQRWDIVNYFRTLGAS